MKSISDATPIIPEIIADVVVREAGNLIEHAHAPAEAVARLCARAERHYQGAGGAQFAKRIRSRSGREYLHAFMRHWLAAELLAAGVSRCQLPYEWGTGGTRPLDCKTNLKD